MNTYSQRNPFTPAVSYHTNIPMNYAFAEANIKQRHDILYTKEEDLVRIINIEGQKLSLATNDFEIQQIETQLAIHKDELNRTRAERINLVNTHSSPRVELTHQPYEPLAGRMLTSQFSGIATNPTLGSTTVYDSAGHALGQLSNGSLIPTPLTTPVYNSGVGIMPGLVNTTLPATNMYAPALGGAMLNTTGLGSTLTTGVLPSTTRTDDHPLNALYHYWNNPMFHQVLNWIKDPVKSDRQESIRQREILGHLPFVATSESAKDIPWNVIINSFLTACPEMAMTEETLVKYLPDGVDKMAAAMKQTSKI